MLLFVCFALVASCEKPSIDNRQEQQALETSNKFIASQFKDDPSQYRPQVHDDGDTWLVSYHVPRGQTGGGPIVQVHKETGAIVGAFAGGQ